MVNAADRPRGNKLSMIQASQKNKSEQRASPCCIERHHCLLGDGTHPTPKRRCCDSRSGESSVDERPCWSQRCRVLSRKGHSNVQGDRTVGIWERQQRRFWLEWNRDLDSPSLIIMVTTLFMPFRPWWMNRLMSSLHGREFPLRHPRYRPHGKALEKVGLTVQVSTKLNRSHLVTGKNALISLVWVELNVTSSLRRTICTVENSMGIVHRSTEDCSRPRTTEERTCHRGFHC